MKGGDKENFGFSFYLDRNVYESYFLLDQEEKTLSLKGQVINILGFTSHTVHVSITELCHCSTKAVIDNNLKCAWLCSNKTLLAKTGSVPDLAPSRVPLRSRKDLPPKTSLSETTQLLSQERTHKLFSPLRR